MLEEQDHGFFIVVKNHLRHVPQPTLWDPVSMEAEYFFLPYTRRKVLNGFTKHTCNLEYMCGTRIATL